MNCKAILTSSLVLLAGCTTGPEAPPKTVRVEVPVSVPCKPTWPGKPTWPTDSLALDAPLWDQMVALRAERKLMRGYIGELEAALRGCE